MRSRAQYFPELVSRAADGSLKPQVRFFRYPHAQERLTTSTGKILGLTGGASNLGNFLLSYRDTIRSFHAHRNKNPIVVLLDNDDGAKQVFSILRQVTGIQQNRDDEFIHVLGNLYVVATKRENKNPSKIEDFFKDADKKDLGTRSFSDSDEFDPAAEYGTVEFATKVVRANADSIDFSGFDELLSTIKKVIEHRANYLAAQS